MTKTLAGADIRGYYTELGVQLPAWAQTDATVPCFADPDAHQHQDHDPSMSVNLEHGAFNCHGCGAKGGAYDAALALGHNPRSAIELMIDHGLTDRRATSRDRRPRHRPATHDPRAAKARSRPPRAPRTRRGAVTDADVQRWHEQLLGCVDVLEHLAATCGWSAPTIRALQLGLDGGQVTIPVRDQQRRLVSLLRYRPDPGPGPGQAKMRAAFGSQRALFPHPAAEASRELLLTEGEPDAIAARSRGLPAIAIPGVDSWRAAWAPLFAGRHVTIVLDADPQGRKCAAQAANDLAPYVAAVVVAELAPDRDDGYDLTDWLSEPDQRDPILLRQLHDLRQPHTA